MEEKEEKDEKEEEEEKDTEMKDVKLEEEESEEEENKKKKKTKAKKRKREEEEFKKRKKVKKMNFNLRDVLQKKYMHYKNTKKLERGDIRIIKNENRIYLNGNKFTVEETVIDKFKTINIWFDEKYCNNLHVMEYMIGKNVNNDILYFGKVGNEDFIVSENNLF